MWYRPMNDKQCEIEDLMHQFAAVYPRQVAAAIVTIMYAACATDHDERIRLERIALRELTAYGKNTCHKPRWWSRQAIMLRDLERRTPPRWARLLHLARRGDTTGCSQLITADLNNTPTNERNQ